jgi:hypothetical protein
MGMLPKLKGFHWRSIISSSKQANASIARRKDTSFMNVLPDLKIEKGRRKIHIDPRDPGQGQLKHPAQPRSKKWKTTHQMQTEKKRTYQLM